MVVDKTKLPIIRYGTLDITKCEVDITYTRESKFGRAKKVKTIRDNKNGITIHPSDRFWTSLFSEYKLGTPSEQFFTYFPYDEVFDRIKKVTDSPLSAICLKYIEGDAFVGYGISRSNTQTRFDGIMDLLSKKGDGLKEYSFNDGVVTARYKAKDPISDFSVAGDEYNGYVDIEVPVDGIGTPITYIGAERLVCTNGVTAMSPVFKSQFKTSEDGVKTLETIIDSYRNEDGFIQLKKRFENADLSYLSMREAMRISKMFSNLIKKDTSNSKLNHAIWQFSDMLGDFAGELGIASLGQVSDKVASGVPMRPSVLSMIQLLSECSTHYINGRGALSIHKFVGGLLSNNYDLELSKSHMGEYDDFLAKK